MDENETVTRARRRTRRGAMAIGATVVALSTAVVTAGAASASPATPVKETPAPGWSGQPVEEKCVVRRPGGPVILEAEEPGIEHEVGDVAAARRVVPAPDGGHPG